MKERRGVYRVWVGKPEGNRPFGRPRHRGADNTNIDLKEVRFEVMNWIELAQDRDRWWALVNFGNESSSSYNAGNFLTS
jgi:hypothetical protein